MAPLTLLPSLSWPAEASLAACLGVGAATDLAAGLPSAVAAAVSSAGSASPSAGAEVGACAETSHWCSAGFQLAITGERYLASIYCGFA